MKPPLLALPPLLVLMLAAASAPMPPRPPDAAPAIRLGRAPEPPRRAQSNAPAPLTAETGWITGFIDEIKLRPTTIEMIMHGQDFDSALITLAKALDCPLIITPAQKPEKIPPLTGRLAGHPLELMDTLARNHGRHIRAGGRADDRILVCEPVPPPVITARSHYLKGARLSEASPVPLASILEKIRDRLGIPPAEQNRVTETGRTIGWRTGTTVQDRRAQYNTDDHAILLNGTPDEHAWLAAALPRLAPRPITLLITENNGRPAILHTACHKVITIGAGNARLFEQPRGKSLKIANDGAITIKPAPQSPAPGIQLWIAETAPEEFTLHVITGETKHTFSILPDNPVRINKTITVTIGNPQPVPQP